jgi:hypothetical protein
LVEGSICIEGKKEDLHVFRTLKIQSLLFADKIHMMLY